MRPTKPNHHRAIARGVNGSLAAFVTQLHPLESATAKLDLEIEALEKLSHRDPGLVTKLSELRTSLVEARTAIVQVEIRINEASLYINTRLEGRSS